MSTPKLISASVIVETDNGSKVIRLSKSNLDALIPVLCHLNGGNISLKDLDEDFEIRNYIRS